MPALSQLNLVAADLVATAAFYRHVGLEIDVHPGAFHAVARLGDGMVVEWDTPEFADRWDSGRGDRGRTGPSGGSVVLGFAVSTPEAVDALHAELTAAGHRDHQPPYDAFWGGRYAIVDDPDGHGVGLMGPTDPARRIWPPQPPPAR